MGKSVVLLSAVFLMSVGLRAKGGDWSPPRPINIEQGYGSELRVTPDGVVLAAWSETDFITHQDVLFSRLVDGVPVAPIVINDEGNGQTPLFCVDSNGNIHIIWSDDRIEPHDESDLFYSLITQDGEEIVDDTPIVTYGAVVARTGADIQFGEDGFVHLLTAWHGAMGYVKFNLQGEEVLDTTVGGILGTHYYTNPRIFPNPDGTADILYIDWMESWPTNISKVFHVKIDSTGFVIRGPTDVSGPDDRTYGILAAARDGMGRLHFVIFEIPYENPSRGPRVHYGVVNSEGMPEVEPWEILPLGDQFGTFCVAVDEFERANLFIVDLDWHSALRPAVDRSSGRRITHFTLNTAGTRSLHSSTVCLTDIGVGSPVFRRDGKGGWIGLFDDSSFWTSTYEVKYIETRQESLCRNSTVDARETYDGRTLWINGSGGDEEHIARVDAGQPLVLSMESSCDIPALRFYVQARPGAPKTSQVTRFPGGGLSCFNFLDHDSAKAIWNGLGGLRGKLGSSRVLRTPIPDPPKAPGVFFTIPGWATQNLPPGTTATFQGFQSDPSSKKGFSVTNAVVLTIE